MSQKLVVVDFQGFKDNKNQFVVKELCVGSKDMHGDWWRDYLFCPPYPETELHRKVIVANSWITRNLTGLQWSSGKIPYHNLEAILHDTTKNAVTITIKGREKASFLRNLLRHRNVIDLDVILPVKLALLPDVDVPCTHGISCAVRNVRKIQNWFNTIHRVIGVELDAKLTDVVSLTDSDDENDDEIADTHKTVTFTDNDSDSQNFDMDLVE